MKNTFAALVAATCLLGIASPSQAGGVGRFLGSLLARGAVVAAVHAGTSSPSSAKSYTPDTLTVSQLAQCIKRAAKLDEDSERIESDRTALQTTISAVDASKATVEQQRTSLDRRSKSAVNSFNALIDRHNMLLADAKSKQSDFNAGVDTHNVDVGAYNGDCAKRYYADDLSEAKKLAGINGG